MSDAPWSVEYTARSQRDLRRLDRQVRDRVLTAVDRLVVDPHGSHLLKLTGQPESRLRIGDWRALVELDTTRRTIVIHRVLPRGRAYDR